MAKSRKATFLARANWPRGSGIERCLQKEEVLSVCAPDRAPADTADACLGFRLVRITVEELDKPAKRH